MKKILPIPILTIAIGYFITNTDMTFDQTEQAGLLPPAQIESTSVDTSEFDQAKALEALREEIKGKEDLPSKEVFKNIEVMKKVPAGRLLRIMEFGFGRSLGVTCTHCHNPNNFADEDKPQKQVTRDMMEMAGKINNELLPAISNLESIDPTINCTTCHRGEVKPALGLDQ